MRNVVGIDPVRVAHVLEGFQYPVKIHITLVGQSLAKAVTAADQIAIMHQEDRITAAEVLYEGVDLIGRIFEHFGNRADTEIPAVVRAALNLNETLHALKIVEDLVHAPVAGRSGRVFLRIAHPNLEFFGYWNYPFEQIFDPLPVHLGGDAPGIGQLGLILGRNLIEAERGVVKPAAAFFFLSAVDGQDTGIIAQ